MKKVGIATIAVSNTYNYGNKFQTYALQQFLILNGCDACIIRYDSDYVQQKEGLAKKLL